MQDRPASATEKAALDIKAMRKAIAAGFAVTDEQVLAEASQRHWVGGAVCVTLWIVQDTVFVANVGLKNQHLSIRMLSLSLKMHSHAHKTAPHTLASGCLLGLFLSGSFTNLTFCTLFCHLSIRRDHVMLDKMLCVDNSVFAQPLA